MFLGALIFEPTDRPPLEEPTDFFPAWLLCAPVAMESIAIQASSAPQVSSFRISLSSCPSGVFRNRSSLSFSHNLGHLLETSTRSPLQYTHSPRIPSVRCCSSAVPLLNSGSSEISLSATVKGFVKADETAQALLLKTKGSELATGLEGTCIYLIGMMGSGKTTVGKLLAEGLDYQFFDSDKLVEDAAGGITVAQFFKEQDEEKFRNAETEVLKKLSCNGRSVVATGGGIVVRPLNWNYLRRGVTVWLDVPLDALAERVVSVGTHTRPLLGESHGESAHSQALARLSSIYECRAPFYAQADVVVSLQELASHFGCRHVRDLTPMMIAVQVLEEINKLDSYKMQRDVAPAA